MTDHGMKCPNTRCTQHGIVIRKTMLYRVTCRTCGTFLVPAGRR